MSGHLTYFIFVIIVLIEVDCLIVDPLDKDFTRTTPELIESRGFKYESYTVLTDDGYILTNFRIVNPYIDLDQLSQRLPVLLFHGIGSNSDSWLISRSGFLNSNGVYSEDSDNENNTIVNDCQQNLTSNLAFTLAACGYDVWLANNRGGQYSNKHIADLADPLYSDYTLTELAIYDIPAVVKNVLTVTEKESLSYIGHSMGTTTVFILLSLKPEFQVYIKPFIAMAPIAYFGNVKSNIVEIAPFEPFARPLVFPIGLSRRADQILGGFVCNNEFLIDECITMLDQSYGADPYNTDKTRIPLILAHSFDFLSIRVWLHYAQLINSKGFHQFNYPTIWQNILKYGQPIAPDYPLNKITSTQIILIKGENDYLSDDRDVAKLLNDLTVQIKANYTISWKEWNHLDYVFAKYANIYMNPIVLKTLNEINNISDDFDITDNYYGNQINGNLHSEE